jgi:hypothetical protein
MLVISDGTELGTWPSDIASTRSIDTVQHRTRTTLNTHLSISERQHCRRCYHVPRVGAFQQAHPVSCVRVVTVARTVPSNRRTYRSAWPKLYGRLPHPIGPRRHENVAEAIASSGPGPDVWRKSIPRRESAAQLKSVSADSSCGRRGGIRFYERL